ncbi:hypothetical protein Csa_018363 [Cucumis sativus]|uniref:Uncharacterized protein n=1 Tax=Cucumis sativus TaxID=3659 RepID=A0A0A0KPP5_CUCSA|nr:hypothetical protein Csa_018363 [Cucumis sativus]
MDHQRASNCKIEEVQLTARRGVVDGFEGLLAVDSGSRWSASPYLIHYFLQDNFRI